MRSSSIRSTSSLSVVLILALGGCSGASDPTPDASAPLPDGGVVEVGDAGEPPLPDGGPSDGGSTTEPGPFAERVVAALCRYATRCPLNELGRFDDAADCRAVLSRRGIGGTDFNGWAAFGRVEAAGFLVVDEAKATACLAAVDGAACDGVLGSGALHGLPACLGVTTGLVADEGDCVADGACVSGLCQRATNLCLGRCRVSKGLGSPCDGDCLPGLVCEAKVGPDKVCQLPGDVGVECGSCKPGLACVRNPASAKNECTVPPSIAGANCATTNACGEGLSCVDSRPPPTCRAYPGDGFPCEFGQFCAPNHLCNLFSPTPTCVAKGDGTDGSACLVSTECASGFACNASGGLGACRAKRGVGTSCEGAEGLCDTELGCQGESGSRTCQPLPATGNCVQGRCASTSVCHYGACIPLGGLNEPCLGLDYAARCRPGLTCLFIEDVGARCRTLPTLGQECPSYACAEGLVCVDDSVSLVCQAVPVVTYSAVGESCANRACDETVSRCVAEPLTPTSITCVARPRLGTACSNGLCAPGLTCRENTCALPDPLTECSPD